MPSNPSDFPPVIEENPESGADPWQNLQSLFDKKMGILREMRDKHGIEKADSAQPIILKDFPGSEYGMWADMFDQGRLRGLSATNAIIKTRRSFNTLTSPILTKEQEDEEEGIYELRQLLEKVLEKINELENCDSKIIVSKKFSVGLMKQVESYFDLIKSSGEAKNLIQEIIVNIGRLSKLTSDRRNMTD